MTKELLTNELIQELLAAERAPCLSLYMSTIRSHPENFKNPIRFKTLVGQMEESLLQKYSVKEAQEYLEPLKALVEDNKIWNDSKDGLAVFSAKGIFKVVALHLSVEELAMVADSFHAKPLRQYLQSVDQFHLLALTLHDIRLFEGNRYSLSEVELTADIPKTISEALGDDLNVQQMAVESLGGIEARTSAMHHGHGSKTDETDNDAIKYIHRKANAF